MSLLQSLANTLAPIYPMAKRLLYRFHGGVFPQYHKSLSARNPIHARFIPQELILPLAQPVGEEAKPLVEVGEQVRKNQLIARADSSADKKLVVPVHAPTSGVIAAIEPRTLPHASGLQSLCIVIKPDGRDDAIDNALNSNGEWPAEPQPLKDILADSGIIGMGGAGFPTYAKLPREKGKIRTLIINGAECEPFISCDDLLMQTHAEEILLGAQITAHALGIDEIVCGIENNKPQAIHQMQTAIEQLSGSQPTPVASRIHEVATVYPMGGQKQLVYEITGVELAARGHAIDQGILMMNVATLRALYRAVAFGEPLTSRLVTVSGQGLQKGFNIDALIGTPFNALAELAEPKSPLDYPLIMGGPMMGVQMPDNAVPVIKTTNCILANPPEPREMQMPCIRCGECMDACPVNLLPQQMYWHAQGHEYEKVEKLNVFDCIECGCCSYVCPSHIPLVQYYRHAKAEIKLLNAEKEAAEVAKKRHEFKLARIEREKAEREARLKAKKEAVKKQSAENPKTDSDSSAKSAAAARAAAAKAAASKKASSAAGDKPLSAREKAILAAQKAAANKQGQTDKDKKVKGQSLTTGKDKEAQAEAAKKRAMAAAKAAAAKKQTAEKETPKESKPLSARDKAIAAAKAAAAKKAAQKRGEEKASAEITETATIHKTDQASEQKLDQNKMPKNSARDKAIAAAKAAAARKKAQEAKNASSEPVETQTTDLTEASQETSPALEKEQARRAAIEKAKAAAQSRKLAQRKQEPVENAEKPASEQTPSTARNAEAPEKASVQQSDQEKSKDKAKSAAKKAAMAAAKRAAEKRAQQRAEQKLAESKAGDGKKQEEETH
ncbi:electron transport complex subunit RsxC [Thiomicrorhabdus xiamenensis]|uniref:Ion-translocating oxidoreductase complex subunit C n=1 Tax=Thiomicrorhabdus xiamenensis TaxID=2739063 RepID=A0A7D4SI13_9GAMM|nr:electron transport complex subunit RsxC [Thiomicrorhabdus xiamenensis]QKI89060.1 electron transport complex subunit RsxC [Thiomicrorhabdus xiamenensis]